MATINDPNSATIIQAVKGANAPPVAADMAAVVAISPNTPTLPVSIAATVPVSIAGTVATSAAALPLPTGAAVSSTVAAAVPATAVAVGLRAATANPGNATSGNLVQAMADKAGRVVVTPTQVRELIGIQQTSVAVTTETTIVTAGAAGVFNDLIGLIITTAGAAAQTITIKDATGGTTRMVLNYPNAAVAPAAPMQLMFSVPISQATAAANWTVTQSLATACNYTAIYAKNT